MPSKLFGKWKVVEKDSDNFDKVMKKVGVDVATRTLAQFISSTTTISEEGENQIRIHTTSTFKSTNVLFTLGEETDERTMDGRNCRTTITWDGEDKLFEIEKWDDGKREMIMEWTLEDDKMILRMECDGLVCSRTHERC